MDQKIDSIDKISSNFSKILLIVFVVCFIVVLAVAGLFVYLLSPVGDDESIIFDLESGWSASTVASELENAGLIRNATVFKIYLKLTNDYNFQAGSYSLNKDMSTTEIIDSLNTGKNIILNTVSITFVEGKRYPYYINKISENFDYTYDEIMDYTTSDEFLEKVIKKYWFIDKTILDDNIYYPLEGYLFADTYEFKKDATIEEIIYKLLDGMEEKLNNYKSEIELSGYSVHSLLTMASVVELEAVTADDRMTVAGVFYNRLNAGDSLGSDVTTYYGVKKDITDSLTVSDINTCNAYNTRGTCNVGSLPVGPICSPSYSSIVAAIEPTETDYYYFVADKNNKLYFGKSEADHLKNIQNLKNQGLWPE